MSDHSEEQQDFQIFQRLCADAAGEFIHDPQKFPDFSVTSVNVGLAVEHTRAFLGTQSKKGSAAKAVDAHQRKACIAIEEAMKSRNFQPYELRIRFTEDPLQATKLAAELLDPLEARLNKHERLQLSREDDPAVLLPKGIWEAEFTPNGDRHHVYTTDGTRLVQGPVHTIQRAIDPKNQILRNFRKITGGLRQYARFYLLVVADSWNMEIDGSSREHVFKSDFDRTFFLERSPERLSVLTTSKDGSCG